MSARSYGIPICIASGASDINRPERDVGVVKSSQAGLRRLPTRGRFLSGRPRNGEHPSSADTVRECPSTTGYWSRLRYYAITEARPSDENEAIGDSRESKQRARSSAKA